MGERRKSECKMSLDERTRQGKEVSFRSIYPEKSYQSEESKVVFAEHQLIEIFASLKLCSELFHQSYLPMKRNVRSLLIRFSREALQVFPPLARHTSLK